MHSAQDASIENLRRQSDLTRENLKETVRELRGRFNVTTTELQALLSPSYVKHEVKSYARRASDDLYNRVEDKIRESPLQAAAIGAVVAYPLLSIFRRMPMPLMLLGAGFWLAKQRGGNFRASDQASLPDSDRQLVSDAPSIVSDPGHGVEMSDLGHGVEKRLDRTAATTSDRLNQAAAAATDRMSKVAAATTQTASRAKRRASNLADRTLTRSRDSVSDMINHHPLLVAGVGIGIGACLAALLPATRTEAHVMGPAHDRLKEEALGAAAKGMDNLRSATDARVQKFSENLNREGGEAIGEAVTSFTERAKTVAERGLDEAFGEERSPAEQPVQKNDSGEAQ